MTTTVTRCSIVELVAVYRAARGDRQHALLHGKTPWTRRDYPFLERLRDVRGLLVIEDHATDTHVTICGSIGIDGFARRIS